MDSDIFSNKLKLSQKLDLGNNSSSVDQANTTTNNNREEANASPLSHLAPDLASHASDDLSVQSFFKDSFPVCVTPTGSVVKKGEVAEKLASIVTSLGADKGNIKHLRSLGNFYMNTQFCPKPKRYQHLIAASTLQIAADTSPEPSEFLTSGKFWLNLGKAHFSIWLDDGILASRGRLQAALKAIENAVMFMEEYVVEDRIKALELKCCVLLYSGDKAGGEAILEDMLKQFPDHPNLPQIYLLLSSLLTSLSRYDRAVDCLKIVLKSGSECWGRYKEYVGERDEAGRNEHNEERSTSDATSFGLRGAKR